MAAAVSKDSWAVWRVVNEKGGNDSATIDLGFASNPDASFN
jgi:hypothetical protein